MKQFIFLGSPLGYGMGPLDTLDHSLCKAANAFFGFKKTLSSHACPLQVKFVLLDTYITSRWRWLAPAAYPTLRALEQIEASKNTFLLSMTRILGDPFESWVRNVTARRRACRLLCQELQGPNWAATWLRQLWRYWGHVWRNVLNLPNCMILRQTGTLALDAGLVRAGLVENLLHRKLQKTFERFRSQHDPPCWELAAVDRERWKNMEAAWVRRWITPLNTACSPAYLMQMQLLVLNAKTCLLRPVRDELYEEPYKRAFLHIREATRLAADRAILVRFEPDQGVSAALLLGSFHPKPVFLVQQPPQELNLLDNVAAAWLVVWHLAKLLYYDNPMHPPKIFVPSVLLQLALFVGIVDSNTRRILLQRLGQFDVLELVQILPQKPPPKYKALLDFPYSATPSDKTLVRTLDASWARFFSCASWVSDFRVPGKGGGRTGR